MTDDRTTMSVSTEGARILADLDGAWFASELAAYEAAIAVAIARNLPLPERKQLGKLETKYNVGSLDPRIREYVTAFYEEGASRPNETARLLAEAGLRYIDQRLRDDMTISQVLGVESDRPSPP